MLKHVKASSYAIWVRASLCKPHICQRRLTLSRWSSADSQGLLITGRERKIDFVEKNSPLYRDQLIRRVLQGACKPMLILASRLCAGSLFLSLFTVISLMNNKTTQRTYIYLAGFFFMLSLITGILIMHIIIQ